MVPPVWCLVLFAVVAGAAASPTGYTRVAGRGFYRAAAVPLSWGDALQACKQDDASLVEVSSDDEAVMVARLMEAAGIDGVAFVGFHRAFDNNVYLHVSGSPLSEDLLSLLDTVNSSVDSTFKCGTLGKKGLLSMQHCDVPRPYVCKMPLWRGYERTDDSSYYRLSQDAVTWKQARALCQQDGAHLAVIRSPEEAAVLSAMMARHQYTPDSSNSSLAAVGVHDMFKKCFYVTVTGEILTETGFSQWAVGEPCYPDEGKDVRCVFLHQETKELVVDSCSSRHVFICEFKPSLEKYKKVNDLIIQVEDLKQQVQWERNRYEERYGK